MFPCLFCVSIPSNVIFFFQSIVSEELDGQNYFWQILLECQDAQIVNEAANILLAIGYFDLSSRLRSNPAHIHHRFINECYAKLKVRPQVKALIKWSQRISDVQELGKQETVKIWIILRFELEEID